MPKQITLKEILTLNPQINRGLLKKAQELSRELQKVGVVKREYNLVSPYTQHHKPVSQLSDLHPKTILLGR